MSKILEVNNLNKDYGNFQLKNVSFSLDRGYIMGFIGPNGAGKSTTIGLIMNLINRDSGTIKIMGKDNQISEVEIKQRIGFVYDENYYYEELKVAEMKYIISKFYKSWNEEMYKKYLEIFELPLNKKIKELSKGLKMKFGLLMALSHEPELLIMDEPTSGLDPVFRSEILGILSDIIQDENKSVLFSTHITSDLDKIADYITFINKGEILFTKTRDEIKENYVVVKGSNKILENNEQLKNGFISIKENAFGFEGLTNNVNDIRKNIKDKITIERPTLDEIMVYLVKGDVKC